MLPGGHVEEVINDAGADEEVVGGGVVAGPGIGGAIGEDFEFPRSLFFARCGAGDDE